jgi:hypothetical protein
MRKRLEVAEQSSQGWLQDLLEEPPAGSRSTCQQQLAAAIMAPAT